MDHARPRVRRTHPPDLPTPDHRPDLVGQVRSGLARRSGTPPRPFQCRHPARDHPPCPARISRHPWSRVCKDFRRASSATSLSSPAASPMSPIRRHHHQNHRQAGSAAGAAGDPVPVRAPVPAVPAPVRVEGDSIHVILSGAKNLMLRVRLFGRNKRFLRVT